MDLPLRSLATKSGGQVHGRPSSSGELARLDLVAENGSVGSSAKTEYCAFTKAVEQLGDRWSLLIVRELAMFGPQGFNTLATGLPGRVSRSVLARRLRKLEELGLVARAPSEAGAGGTGPYRLAPAGEQLVPTLQSLWRWAEQWVPEDPAMARREPSVILWWLAHRVDPDARPDQQVAIEFGLRLPEGQRQWLLLGPANEAELCLEDPLLGEERYLFVEADADALYPISRGQQSWVAATRDGSVTIHGDPGLVADLPGWFLAPAEPMRPRAAVPEPMLVG